MADETITDEVAVHSKASSARSDRHPTSRDQTAVG
jgi:hypothetical protein